MIRVVRLACSLLLLSLAARAEPAPLADPANDPQWQPLFDALSADVSRYSLFEERRLFRVRREPVVLTGEIRHAPGHGISLHYLTPEPRTMIIDDQGVLLRDARGRSRAAPVRAQADATTAALRHVLRFDARKLAEIFTIQGSRTGERWTLRFVPRDSAATPGLEAITLSGSESLERIEIDRAKDQRIEIAIRETHTDVAFGDVEMKRYFRAP